jgi:hypothetical protein
MERLTAAGPVLVHFFDFGQLNSVRTLPYLRAWHEGYAAAGLTVVGIDTPRHPFSEDPDAVAAAAERLEIPYPVLADASREAWADYGCHGWPSLFLWSQGGALRWFHFGEGEYAATEEAIREQLESVIDLPPVLDPLRPVDVPGAALVAPTPELLPGGSESEPWRAGAEAAQLEIEFAAGGAFATLDGAGAVEIELDGEPLPPLRVDHPGIYPLTPEEPHTEHRLAVRPGPEVLVYSISFAAGPPA